MSGTISVLNHVDVPKLRHMLEVIATMMREAELSNVSRFLMFYSYLLIFIQNLFFPFATCTLVLRTENSRRVLRVFQALHFNFL